MYSMKRRIRPSSRAHRASGRIDASFMPRRTTVLILIGDSPAARAAAIPSSTRETGKSTPFIGPNTASSSESRLTVIRCSPASASGAREGLERRAVGRQGEVDRLAVGRAQRRQVGDQRRQVAADQRLAAGDPELVDAEPDEDRRQPRDLLERQHLLARQEREVAAEDLGRHAVRAAEVASVGDRDPQVPQRAAESVRQAGAAVERVGGRTARSDRGRRAGPRPHGRSACPRSAVGGLTVRTTRGGQFARSRRAPRRSTTNSCARRAPPRQGRVRRRRVAGRPAPVPPEPPAGTSSDCTTAHPAAYCRRSAPVQCPSRRGSLCSWPPATPKVVSGSRGAPIARTTKRRPRAPRRRPTPPPSPPPTTSCGRTRTCMPGWASPPTGSARPTNPRPMPLRPMPQRPRPKLPRSPSAWSRWKPPPPLPRHRRSRPSSWRTCRRRSVRRPRRPATRRSSSSTPTRARSPSPSARVPPRAPRPCASAPTTT